MPERAPFDVVPYRRKDGSSPFEDWFRSLDLKDSKAATRVAQRISRLKWGHLGSYDHVGEGVLELIDHYGPGFRVYIARSGRTLYLLLIGGTKHTQRSDIGKAIALKREFAEGTTWEK